MRRVLRASATGLFVLSLILSAAWANLAITYQLRGPPAVRIGACLILDLMALAALLAVMLRRRGRWRALLVYAVAYAIFLGWSSSISASNDKNWAADVAHGIAGTIDGDRLSARHDWRIMLTGHLPSYLYEHGAVDTRIPLEELCQRVDITNRVDASSSEVEFSSRLREGAPVPR